MDLGPVFAGEKVDLGPVFAGEKVDLGPFFSGSNFCVTGLSVGHETRNACSLPYYCS